MKLNDDQCLLLLRHLDGATTPEETAQALELLRTLPDARAFVRSVSEQAVMMADLGRMEQTRQPAQDAASLRPAAAPAARRGNRPRILTPARTAGILAAVVALLFVGFWIARVSPQPEPWILRISKATGSSQIFGARGERIEGLEPGMKLIRGDTLETRSCDAWIELETRNGSHLTVGGHSDLRLREGRDAQTRLSLLRGSLWYSPAEKTTRDDLEIETPTLMVQDGQAQFDLQTSPTETLLRVNRASASVRHLLGGNDVFVNAGQQVSSRLDRSEALAPKPQPEPVDRWTCDLQQGPEVILGRWLPPDANDRPRIGADPLLWPLPNRDPVLLHVVAVSVARRSGRPVSLTRGASLVFRGRTEIPHTVRFGFTCQRMQGVYAGKFEWDVHPEIRNPIDNVWEVTLPLSVFRPLQPQMSPSPDGLELTDVYALTIEDEVGLEIHHIELITPPSSPTEP